MQFHDLMEAHRRSYIRSDTKVLSDWIVRRGFTCRNLPEPHNESSESNA